ncbi:MAG TPA: FixH family protein [Vicinamibacterales bacterium]|nr:FixH family protein [Vicinamibacterales bacterium]
MRTINRLFVVYALLVLSGCTSSSQTPNMTQGQTTTASPAATSSSGGVAIEFLSEPDPPKAGDNTIEVTVRQPDGTAITDAAVTAVFSMPAMPAMNMPAMRAEVKLTHIEGVRYRGMGQLSMAGTWNVTVTATRDGEPIGRRSFSIVAK